MPTHSPFPDVVIPNVDLWDFIFEREDRLFPDDKVIFLDSVTDRSYSFADVRRAGLYFGQKLRRTWNWKKGDVLAFFTPNSVDTPAAYWGCLWAGGIVSPINCSNTTDELALQLQNCRAVAIVTQRPFLNTVSKAISKVGLSDDRILIFGDDEEDNKKWLPSLGSIPDEDGFEAVKKEKVVPKDDLAFLVFSSGTTGIPKGVMLSHTNIVANALLLAAGEGGNLTWNSGLDGKGDRTLAFLPFFHIYGFACEILQVLYNGFTAVVMRKFEIESFLSSIQNRRITFVYVVPPVLLLLAKHLAVDKYNLSSVRMLSSGAAPLTANLVEDVYDRLKIPTKQGYGISEMSATVHAQAWKDWRTPAASVGILLPNQTAKITSPDGKEVEIGKTGELVVKGPNIFKGYLNNTEATLNSLTPDGYFKTGDVGFQDAAGNFFITDRLKEVIKYKGFQVAPAELEGIIVAHPKVDDAAVVGIYENSIVSEIPRAFVVPSKSVEVNDALEKEILGWVEARVANYKKLRGGVRFIDSVPRSASGKILRRLIKIPTQGNGAVSEVDCRT